MKKTINLNFILRNFFDPKLITLSIFLSLIILTASFSLQKKFTVFIVDVYFKNNINSAVIYNEINKLQLEKDSELSVNDLLKLDYIRNFYLPNREIYLELKTNLIFNEYKKIENELNGEIKFDSSKNLNNSNFLSFKFIKILDHANQENTYYDTNSTRLVQDITNIFNRFVSENLKKKQMAYDYLNQKDFVFVHISSVKENKFNFLLLFSTFIFISLFINLIFVLFKFRKNILI